MATKVYFEAIDKQGHYDLWWTDGTTTQAVGGLSNIGVSGVSNEGLGPAYIAAFGQQMIFAGEDALNNTNSNGIWLTDGTPGGTTEVGGVSPGPGNSSSITNANPSGLNPTDFVVFGAKALFFGTDAASNTTLWSTDGTVGGTVELGGLDNGQIAGRGTNWNPSNFFAFGDKVLFDGFDSSGGGASYRGVWISDGTSAGTVELGGLQNAAVFDSGTSEFRPISAIALGSSLLFDAANKAGHDALWISDGTAAGTFEIGGVDNAGVVGANNIGFGGGLDQAVRFGAHIFFSAYDTQDSNTLWVTDGTAGGTQEIGGIGDANLAPGQKPSSIGLNPTDLTVNGQQVLFNGRDAIGFQELWVTDGSANGTYEIGGAAPSGFVTNEAPNGLDPESIVSLGNGKAVFIGHDDSNNSASGKPTLWVTDGTTAGTQEIGGSDNQNVAGIFTGGFSFTGALIGGDGLAYFMGENAAGNQVLWQTDGTLGGTKVDAATDGNAPATGLSATGMTLAAPPPAENSFSGGGQNINLNNIPGDSADLANTNNVWDTVTGSNGSINLSAAWANVIGGGVLITLKGVGNAVNLSNTKGNKDSVYGSKGAITLSGAQANVFGGKNNITFANGTTGNVVYLFDTQGQWDNVTGSGGAVHLFSAQANVTGGSDAVYFDGGAGNQVSLYSTNGAWDTVYAKGGQIDVTTSQVSVVGGLNTVYATANCSVSVYSTNGGYDTVKGSSDKVILNSAQASIFGGGHTILAGAGSTASLYSTSGNWDAVDGSGEKVILTSAQAAMNGGGVTVYANAGSSMALSGTNGAWDTVHGSSDVVNLTTAKATIIGGGDTIWANAGSSASLQQTGAAWDAFHGSNDSIVVVASRASIVGGSDTINATAGSWLSLYNTNGHADAITGSSVAVYVNSSQTTLIGSGDPVYLSGSSSVNSQGKFNSFHFGAQLGVSALTGFNATDLLYLSASDWSSFSALQSSGDLFQSGADLHIKISATNDLTLVNTQLSTLSASDVKFV